eukprot:CAMPEP_0202855766 /NCGR_PEP_ID=MMETSP1389-20130828/91684_1 /ASSEMBLY_ACC=CAM_ASM_000865 /TAXON_ID=302021 /ORGANISM="Rhodomonas sp., Strain CCMP768" /LENGTH=388 /DNA_ID=CAMNT_0049534389 /DNA_START=56 /DNA_END=1222 /DNA_ORIENTATION=+
MSGEAQPDFGSLRAERVGSEDSGLAIPCHQPSDAHEQQKSHRAQKLGGSKENLLSPKEDLEKATMYTFDEEEEVWAKKVVYVRIAEKPFQQGTFRVCYKMWLLDENGEEHPMVAKMFKKDKSVEEYFNEAFCQVISEGYAKEFNKIGMSRSVQFAPVHVLKLHERDGTFVTAEPFLKGSYVKHNDNDGHVDTLDPVPQAFSHFSWHASEGKLLICDIQGVGDHYTDPSIQTPDADRMFGSGNIGEQTIVKFFRSHHCNCLCRAHGLRSPRAELQALGAVLRASSHSEDAPQMHERPHPQRPVGKSHEGTLTVGHPRNIRDKLAAEAGAGTAKKGPGWGVSLNLKLVGGFGHHSVSTGSTPGGARDERRSPIANAFRRVFRSTEASNGK